MLADALPPCAALFALFALSGYYSHIGGPWQSPIPALRLYRVRAHTHGAANLRPTPCVC